jgi:hypothetical protein
MRILLFQKLYAGQLALVKTETFCEPSLQTFSASQPIFFSATTVFVPDQVGITFPV